jgi:hypothetical protein
MTCPQKILLPLLCVFVLLAAPQPVRGDTLLDIGSGLYESQTNGKSQPKSGVLYENYLENVTAADESITRLGQLSRNQDSTLTSGWLVDAGSLLSQGALDYQVDAKSNQSAGLSLTSAITFWIEGDAGTPFQIERTGKGTLRTASGTPFPGSATSNYSVNMFFLGIDGIAVDLFDQHLGSSAAEESFSSSMLAGSYAGISSAESRILDGITYTKALSLSESLTIETSFDKIKGKQSFDGQAAFQSQTLVTGASDTAAPTVAEPSSLVSLAGLAVIGLACHGWRRRKRCSDAAMRSAGKPVQRAELAAQVTHQRLVG